MRDPLDPKNSRAPTAACGCNKELPCDTYRRCIAQTKASRVRMLDGGDEGDDLRFALAAQVAAERYDNLTSRTTPPAETENSMASLVELYDACSECLARSASDRQVELFNRVHLLLDWDERHEVLRILNGVERLDGDDGARDCFAAHQESGLSINLSVLFCRLCCFDSDYLSRPHDFRRVCLCGNNGVCVNPQHYVTAERRRPQQQQQQCTATTRRLCKRNRNEMPSEQEVDDADCYDKINEIDFFSAAAAIVAAETCLDADETEKARLAALAVCLDDQFALQNEATSRRLASTQQNQHQLPTSKLRQQKEDYFDLRSDDGESFAGAKTPILLSYADACRSAAVDKPPNKEPRKEPSPSSPPPLLVSAHCKSMANKVEELLRSRYSLDVII